MYPRNISSQVWIFEIFWKLDSNTTICTYQGRESLPFIAIKIRAKSGVHVKDYMRVTASK